MARYAKWLCVPAQQIASFSGWLPGAGRRQTERSTEMLSLEKLAAQCGTGFGSLDFRFDPAGVSPAQRAEILQEAERYAALPWPMRKATDFLAFVRTGSRKADEDPYFLRRQKLCWATLACAMGEESYLDQVVDGVWCICEESTWVISAHNINPIPGAPAPEERPLPVPGCPYIDLFAAQTGMILILVKALAGQKLDQVSPVLTARISREVRSRILQPFLDCDDCWWMGFRRKDLCNWTPWIVSNVLLCGLTEPMDSSERSKLVVRACGMLDRWLDVVPEDGGCDEGAGYWNMAGGSLLDCLEMLEESSGGAISLWREEKIRNILSFPLRAEIGKGYFLNFADCDARPFLSGERVETAGRLIGDPGLEALGRRLRGPVVAELSDVPHFSRLLKALAPASPGLSGGGLVPSADLNAASGAGQGPSADGSAPASPAPDVWLPDLQVRVVRRGGWILAAKGGHNGESHNHNDVGSFMLYADGEPEIVDAGNMTYSAKTFSDHRYELWNTRSAYHNLPLIGGEEQRPGKEYAAREVQCLENGLSLELAGAYGPEAGVLSFRRMLALEAGSLRVSDRIVLSREAPVTWVFLFRREPMMSGKSMKTEKIRLDIPDGFEVRTEEIPVTDPRMAQNWPGSLWRVLLTAPSTLHQEADWVFVRPSFLPGGPSCGNKPAR